jgi:hypothetical protein
MSDIVERLRHHAKYGDGWTRPDAGEAADEIERLRHELTIARLDRDHAQRIVNEARAERDEAAATLALYRMEHGCTRGQRTTQWCGEATRLRRAWLRVIQAENQCPASGGGCLSAVCGCLAEMEMLLGEERA